MSAKHDLENSIRATYTLIGKYTEKIQLSDDPQEQARCHHTIHEQKALIREYLAQYYQVCATMQQPAEDIREIAAILDANLLPSATPHPSRAAPGTVISHITISNSNTGDVAGRDINKTATPDLLHAVGTLIQRIRGD